MPPPPSLAKLLSEAETTACEHVEQTLSGSFDQLAARLEQEFDANRRELTGAMNQAVRRLRDAGSSAEWCRALLDATTEFCESAALFSVAGGRLHVLGARNLPLNHESALELPLASAPAFATAAESKEPLVAIRSAGEFSSQLIAALGESTAQRAHLFPLSNGRTVTAVLYTEDGDVSIDSAGLEFLTAVAGLAMEHRIKTQKGAAPGLITLAPRARDLRVARDWSELSREEQETHLGAQRYARAKVAAMRLHQPERVKAGRETGNLYEALKEEIESARREFETEFVAATPTMLDYFHLELLRTLANGNDAALGPAYPGPLV